MPDAVDEHVGAQIRLRRQTLAITQKQLAQSLGVTFQQVQKYERGANRVGASRLQAIASILAVPVSYFFEDAPVPNSPAQVIFNEEHDASTIIQFCNSSEGRQLNRAFQSIADPQVRRRIIDLVRSLAADAEA